MKIISWKREVRDVFLGLDGSREPMSWSELYRSLSSSHRLPASKTRKGGTSATRDPG
jgi:hypothetical protein